MASLYDTLQGVLNRAHRDHVYVSDQEKYDLREHWTVNLEGDCEDFALWIRNTLCDEYDIQPDLVFCLTENSVGHLVCSVDGWILDNRHDWVMGKDELPYRWLKIGKPDGTWYTITE